MKDANDATRDRFLTCSSEALFCVSMENPGQGLPPDMTSTADGEGTDLENRPPRAWRSRSSTDPRNGCRVFGERAFAIYVCMALSQMSLAHRHSITPLSSSPRPR